METPVYTKLIKHFEKQRISFAMPGHKNLRGLPTDLIKCDVTELASTVDLHHESTEVVRANALLSEFYGTKASFIMTGGSTAGVQTMLASVLRPGDTVLADADCHLSVINTCALCGFRLKLLPVSLYNEFMIPAVADDLELTEDIKAVILTSPNYYGMVKDIKRAADVCHAAGIPLLVDEAHGAHFAASDGFPESAVSLGADMVCHSAHKTLGALTGAAYLHICSDKIDIGRVKRALCAFQTSSPSYPIAASADTARAELEKKGYADIIDECRRFREAICRATGIRVLENDDITRIVLNFSAYETTGFKVSGILSDYFGIDTEMADLFNVVLIATPWNRHAEFMRLFEALRDITETLPERAAPPAIMPPPAPEGVITPSEGWFADTETVSLDKAAGRISAATVTAYPPGTAVTVTGAVITREQTEYIGLLDAAGAELTGIEGRKIEVVK